MKIADIKETLKNDLEFNRSVTENDALGFRTTSHPLLDINFKVASLRGADESYIIEQFMKAFYEDRLLAMKWLFYARDARAGLGERQLFRVIMSHLCINHLEIIKHLIPYIPEYGRFDDLWDIFDTPANNIVLEYISRQLTEDKQNMADHKPISLLAKWLPSVNTSSAKTTKRAKQLLKLLNMSEKEYRKLLSSMRKYIDVVECKMSAKHFDEIVYENVPSKANLIYSDAFLRHDTERRTQYLESLKKGETKINASVLMPYEIVHAYVSNGLRQTDDTLESLWKALPDTVDSDNQTIVVADGSGSMTAHIGKSSVSALSVANSIAIYFAERASGEFKDKYITFSMNPQLVDFSKCASLKEKIGQAILHNEIANTNIEAVFSLILKTALRTKASQKDLPRNVLIISDMEFDICAHSSLDRRVEMALFDAIAQKYAEHGYLLPRLIFWNVNSRTGTIPVIENELGVALVSGFSVNIVKMVMSGNLDPFECLKEQLLSARYEKIVV